MNAPISTPDTRATASQIKRSVAMPMFSPCALRPKRTRHDSGPFHEPARGCLATADRLCVRAFHVKPVTHALRSSSGYPGPETSPMALGWNRSRSENAFRHVIWSMMHERSPANGSNRNGRKSCRRPAGAAFPLRPNPCRFPAILPRIRLSDVRLRNKKSNASQIIVFANYLFSAFSCMFTSQLVKHVLM